MRFLSIYPWHRDLNDLKATHYTLGVEYIHSGIKITLEAYSKEYENMLIDPKYPMYLASELAIDNYYYPYELTNDGSGYARGIELLIHKKLVKHFHGIFCASIFRSRYKDFDGITRRSSYENRYIINLTAGYKPNSKWAFGLRWTIIGGRPRTPFDLEASRQYNYLVYDQDLSKFNTENYPAYNKLSLRAERRFYFRKTNIVVYLDIWNVLNRKNFFEYTWNPGSKDVEPTDEQMPIMPILGFKFEF
jgi:outer membrane receptor for ferrienterochelin and colicin